MGRTRDHGWSGLKIALTIIAALLFGFFLGWFSAQSKHSSAPKVLKEQKPPPEFGAEQKTN